MTTLTKCEKCNSEMINVRTEGGEEWIIDKRNRPVKNNKYKMIVECFECGHEKNITRQTDGTSKSKGKQKAVVRFGEEWFFDVITREGKAKSGTSRYTNEKYVHINITTDNGILYEAVAFGKVAELFLTGDFYYNWEKINYSDITLRLGMKFSQSTKKWEMNLTLNDEDNKDLIGNI